MAKDNWVAGLTQALQAVIAGLDRGHYNRERSRDREADEARDLEMRRYREEDQRMQRERHGLEMARMRSPRTRSGQPETPFDKLKEAMALLSPNDAARGQATSAFTSAKQDPELAIAALQDLLKQTAPDDPIPSDKDSVEGIDEETIKRIEGKNKMLGERRGSLDSAIRVLETYKAMFPPAAATPGATPAQQGIDIWKQRLGGLGQASPTMFTEQGPPVTSYDQNTIPNMQAMMQELQAGLDPALAAVLVNSMSSNVPLRPSEYLRTAARKGPQAGATPRRDPRVSNQFPVRSNGYPAR